MLIDSHCHLADAAFADDLSAVVERATLAGLTTALCIVSADEPEEVARASEVFARWPEVHFSTGVHPHRAGGFAGRPEAAAAATDAAANATAAVAIGEIGLDYHYDFAPRDVQREVFAAQVTGAGRRGLPVVIHTREATEDTLAVLRDARPAVTGVLHCFTGDVAEARRALDLGLYISLAGIVTFPRAQALREVAAFVPADRLLLETDAPFLAPVPHRGQRNEPAWVVETFRTVARIRGVPDLALATSIADNFRRLTGARS